MEESLFTGIDPVRILEFGTAGLAFLCLFMAYGLISSANKRFSEKDFSQIAENKELIEKWFALAKSQTRNAQFFLVISLLIFALSAGVTFFKPKNPMHISVSPASGPSVPRVSFKSASLAFKEGGCPILVEENNQLHISNEKAIKYWQKNLRNM